MSEVNILLCSHYRNGIVTMRLTAVQIKTLLEEGQVFTDTRTISTLLNTFPEASM